MTGNGSSFHGRFISAMSFMSRIRIIRLGSNSMFFFNDFVATGQRTSATTSTTTVKKHLFRKTNLFISSYNPCGFNNSNLCKCPTTSTLSLIFNRAHDICPIFRVRSGRFQFHFQFRISNISVRFIFENSCFHQNSTLEFIPSPIGIKINSDVRDSKLKLKSTAPDSKDWTDIMCPVKNQGRV